MKLKIKQTTETEIEVTLPLSFATDSAYYHIYDEKRAISVWPRINCINTVHPEIALSNYKPELVVNKWEVEEVFNDVVHALAKEHNFSVVAYEEEEEKSTCTAFDDLEAEIRRGL